MRAQGGGPGLFQESISDTFPNAPGKNVVLKGFPKESTNRVAERGPTTRVGKVPTTRKSRNFYENLPRVGSLSRNPTVACLFRSTVEGSPTMRGDLVKMLGLAFFLIGKPMAPQRQGSVCREKNCAGLGGFISSPNGRFINRFD